jgi:hypothetical protein
MDLSLSPAVQEKFPALEALLVAELASRGIAAEAVAEAAHA